LLEKIHGFEYDPVNGEYKLDPMKSFCFNTSDLAPMGVALWEEDEEWEQINWYMKIAKCDNNTSSVICKPIEEIDAYIERMFLTRTVRHPLVDVYYLDGHKYDI